MKRQLVSAHESNKYLQRIIQVNLVSLFTIRRSFLLNSKHSSHIYELISDSLITHPFLAVSLCVLVCFCLTGPLTFPFQCEKSSPTKSALTPLPSLSSRTSLYSCIHHHWNITYHGNKYTMSMYETSCA